MELLKELIIIGQKRALAEFQSAIGEVLSESIVEYLSTVLGHLKTKEYLELFNKERPLVKIDQLAAIIAGVKVLADHEIRSTLTTDDVRINPNSSMQLFNLLDSIPKDGKGIPKLTADVFHALAEVSPKHFAEEKVKLKGLKSKNEAERQRTITEIEKLSEKVAKMFEKVRSIAHGEEEY